MRVLHALFYALIGSFLFPIVGALLLLPVFAAVLLWHFLPTAITALYFAQPITFLSVPFVEAEGNSLLVIPAFGAFFFALGGAFMRPLGDWRFDDVRLLRCFCGDVMGWMARGVVFGGVWGAILGFALANIETGVIMGAIWGEIGGLIVGTARGAFVRKAT
jgi:hypothetical protein